MEVAGPLCIWLCQSWAYCNILNLNQHIYLMHCHLQELRDRNDELQIQLETLRSQLSESRYSRLLAKMKDNKLLHHKAKDKIDDGHSKSVIYL